jgi:hypothetical protein
MWLVTSALGADAFIGIGTIDLASGAPSTGVGPEVLGGLLSSLIPLVVLFVELLGAIGLVLGAIWRLERE